MQGRIQRWMPAGILGLWLGLVVMAPWLNLQPDHIELSKILAIPDSTAWLGYDDLGVPCWIDWWPVPAHRCLWRCGWS